jgi:hypothetical protein
MKTRLLSPRRFDQAETAIRCPDVTYGTNSIHSRVDWEIEVHASHDKEPDSELFGQAVAFRNFEIRNPTS